MAKKKTEIELDVVPTTMPPEDALKLGISSNTPLPPKSDGVNDGSNDGETDGVEEEKQEFLTPEFFNKIASLHTIENGKLQAIQDAIYNVNYAEAISLLKTLQTADYYQVQEIIAVIETL